MPNPGQGRITRWMLGPTHRTVLQIPRALIASGVAAAVDVGLLIALVELAGMPPVWAASLSYVVGGIVQYALCALWVFPCAPANVPAGVVAFLGLSLMGLGITSLTMAVLHGHFRVNYLLSKAAAMALAFCWNFLSRKYLLFTAPRQARSGTSPSSAARAKGQAAGLPPGEGPTP